MWNLSILINKLAVMDGATFQAKHDSAPGSAGNFKLHPCPGCQHASSNLQALSRGSQAFSGTGRRSNSGRLARSGSLDTALNPKQMHLELELVAIGVGLQFVELEEGRKVQPLTTIVELVTSGVSA